MTVELLGVPFDVLVSVVSVVKNYFKTAVKLLDVLCVVATVACEIGQTCTILAVENFTLYKHN